MSESRIVRLICTDGGAHPRRVLGAYRLVGQAVERAGAELSAVDSSIELQCPRCPRNARLSPDRLHRAIGALLSIYAEPVVMFDISGPAARAVFS